LSTWRSEAVLDGAACGDQVSGFAGHDRAKANGPPP
jgi:hypothetical protein